MIPYGLTPDQFCRRYRRYLQRATPTTIAALRALLVRPLPDQPLRRLQRDAGREAAGGVNVTAKRCEKRVIRLLRGVTIRRAGRR